VRWRISCWPRHDFDRAIKLQAAGAIASFIRRAILSAIWEGKRLISRSWLSPGEERTTSNVALKGTEAAIRAGKAEKT
jgi:hypothetical protein